mgnify:CR=1 FL=1
MFGLRLPEIIVIALIVLLLFGGKRIPELMKSLGRGVKNFKEGMNSDVPADDKTAQNAEDNQANK